MTNKNIFHLSLKEKHRCYQLDNCEEESYINALLGFYLESKTVPNQTYKDIWV